MVKLSNYSKTKLKSLNEHMQDGFIVSVSNKKIQMKLLAMSDNVTTEALKVALVIESSVFNVENIQTPISPILSQCSCLCF